MGDDENAGADMRRAVFWFLRRTLLTHQFCMLRLWLEKLFGMLHIVNYECTVGIFNKHEGAVSTSFFDHFLFLSKSAFLLRCLLSMDAFAHSSALGPEGAQILVWINIGYGSMTISDKRWRI